MLLDCGPSAVHRMAAEQLDWAAVDAIWISHFHLDHVGGLAPFLFAMKYAPATRERTAPLGIFGPAGLGGLLAKFDDANDYRLFEQRFPVTVDEVETLERFEPVAGVTAVAARTPHTPESHALHLGDADGTTLVYTSDTGFHEPLASLAGNADLFLLECSFVENKPVEKHLELAEAIYLVRKAKPRRAMLTHLYPEWDDVEFSGAVAELETGCPVIEAVDGLRLEFCRP